VVVGVDVVDVVVVVVVFFVVVVVSVSDRGEVRGPWSMCSEYVFVGRMRT
jgi:hypothetical protein